MLVTTCMWRRLLLIHSSERSVRKSLPSFSKWVQVAVSRSQSSVCVRGWATEESWFDLLQGEDISLLPNSVRTCVSEALRLLLKQVWGSHLESKAAGTLNWWHTPSGAELYLCSVLLYAMHWDNFTFTFTLLNENMLTGYSVSTQRRATRRYYVRGSTPTLGPTQCVPSLFPGAKATGAWR